MVWLIVAGRHRFGAKSMHMIEGKTPTVCGEEAAITNEISLTEPAQGGAGGRQ